MRTKARLLIPGVAVAALLLSSGCGKKLTFERWESLRVGDTRAAVKAALGKPRSDAPGRMTWTEQDEGIAVEVWLDPQTQHVLYTEWSDPAHGMRAKGERPGP